ncbi:hypothetical protein PM082_021591 [Marasmius tenuissimus]|nr:hypothetical protein PM082_021591 [Marasmius tenuissimus]
MQCKAAIWVTGAFRTSPTGGVEALAGLIPIHIHLRKLAIRADYRVATLLSTHPTRSLLRGAQVKDATPHPKSLATLTEAVRKKVKGTVMEIDKVSTRLTEEFDPPPPRLGSKSLHTPLESLRGANSSASAQMTYPTPSASAWEGKANKFSFIMLQWAYRIPYALLREWLSPSNDLDWATTVPLSDSKALMLSNVLTLARCAVQVNSVDGANSGLDDM